MKVNAKRPRHLGDVIHLKVNFLQSPRWAVKFVGDFLFSTCYPLDSGKRQANVRQMSGKQFAGNRA